jgi:hypothetical protein
MGNIVDMIDDHLQEHGGDMEAYLKSLEPASAPLGDRADLKITYEYPDCNHNQYCDNQTIDMKCKSITGCNFKD